ncbi:MAG: hypothetical protein KTR35_04210 [Gammaproteobacteria bacterium]|nr:hypothetical protein [Gammaproteobacteria bacterium]
MVNKASSKAKPCIGVLMLNTRFPRYLGDIGNPHSFEGPVIHRVVETANVANVVKSSVVSDELLEDFISASQSLIAEGADIITTSCGFLFAAQDQLQSNLSCPVIASSLIVLPRLLGDGPGTEPVGVFTFDSDALSLHGLENVDQERIVVAGLQNTEHFYPVIRNDEEVANFDSMRSDVLSAARQFESSQLSAVVLECTNLSPYKKVLQAQLGVPVYDLFDALDQAVVNLDV